MTNYLSSFVNFTFELLLLLDLTIELLEHIGDVIESNKPLGHKFQDILPGILSPGFLRIFYAEFDSFEQKVYFFAVALFVEDLDGFESVEPGLFVVDEVEEVEDDFVWHCQSSELVLDALYGFADHHAQPARYL